MERILVTSCLVLLSSETAYCSIACPDETSRFVGEPIIATSKRSSDSSIQSMFGKNLRRDLDPEPFFPQNPLPWSCSSVMVWRDLGENHYPRFVKDMNCSQERCWYGYYSCIPQRTNVKILRFNRGECIDTALPAPLQRDWQFQDVQITVSCMCSRTL